MFRRIETAGNFISRRISRRTRFADEPTESSVDAIDDAGHPQKARAIHDDFLNEISSRLDAHLVALQTSFRQWSGRQENLLCMVMQRMETASMMKEDSLPVSLPSSPTSRRVSEPLEIPKSMPWSLKAPGSADCLDSVPESAFCGLVGVDESNLFASSRDCITERAMDSNDHHDLRKSSSGSMSNLTSPTIIGHESTEDRVAFLSEGSPTSNGFVRPIRKSVIDKVEKMRQIGGSGILDGMSRQPTSVIKELFVSGTREWTERRRQMNQFVFEVLCAMAIVVHAILSAVETEYQIHGNAEPDFLGVVAQAFNVWFLLEMLIRMWTAGLKKWWTSKEDSKWNMFDLALVFLWFVDIMSFTFPYGEFQGIFRILRLLRVLRTLRIFRFVRAVREFRKMIYAIANSVNTLMWAMVLLVFELFFFSIAFLQAVINLREESGNRNLSKVYDKWGGLAKAYYSLFRSMSGGISWGEVLDPLLEFSPSWLYVGMFILFISATLFGIMNVLTAVFVESAMSSTTQNRDMLVLEKERSKRMYVTHIKEIFKEIDDDGSGFISLGEIEQIFSNPTMSRVLQALEIEAYDARSMFRLLDLDDSGSVDIEEFCDGCLRLKGEAKSFDIQCLMYENQRLVAKTRALMVRHEEALGDIRQGMRVSSEHNSRKFQSLHEDVASLTTGLAELKKLAVKTLKRQESPFAAGRQVSQLGPVRSKSEPGIHAKMNEDRQVVNEPTSPMNSRNSTGSPESRLGWDSKRSTTPNDTEDYSSREQTRTVHRESCMTILDWQPKEAPQVKEFFHFPDASRDPRFGPICPPPEKLFLQGVVRL